jgi:curved DNA-binding protein CbpA
MQDYYAMLGVTPDATQQEIKSAYRRLARLHHPDLNKEARDDLIKRLNQAYEILRDPQKRAAYDMQFARRGPRSARLSQRQPQPKRDPEMTWFEGAAGFVIELKKGLKDD